MSEMIRYEPGQALTPAAPIDRFDELLQQGQIAEALDLRLDAIESSAREHRTDCEAAKLSAVGLAGAGLLMSASPIIGLLGGLGAVAYGVVLFQDYQKTKRFCPIPAVRKTLPELLTGVGNAADRVESKQVEDPLADTLCFLEPAIAHEYELLQVRELEMQRYLEQFPPAKRLLAYRVALRQTRLRDTLALPTMQQAATMEANLQPDAATSEPPQYANYTTSAQEAAPTDAIDVPATQIQQPAAAPINTAPSESNHQVDYSESRTPTPITTPATPQPACPVRYLIGDRLRTSLIVSVSGGGKDILLSNALREFQKVYPAFRVVVADCKDDPKEYGYYDNLPNVSIHRLNVAIASDGEVVQWVDDWVTEFNYLPEQALLICNEGTLIRKKSQRYVDAVGGLVSSGDSRQKFAWEAGQSAHTKALKIDGDERSRFRLLLIGLKGEEMQVEAILQAQCVADSARNMHDIKTQMMRSPVSRTWSDGQAWYAMPKLENYSGYDRDSRSHLAGFATPQQQNLRDRLEGIYQVESVSQEFPSKPETSESFPETAEAAGKFPDTPETSEAQSESGFPASEDWRKYFPETAEAIEKAVFLAYRAALEAGNGKQKIIDELLGAGTSGRRYQAASKYLDYLCEKFGGQHS